MPELARFTIADGVCNDEVGNFCIFVGSCNMLVGATVYKLPTAAYLLVSTTLQPVVVSCKMAFTTLKLAAAIGKCWYSFLHPSPFFNWKNSKDIFLSSIFSKLVGTTLSKYQTKFVLLAGNNLNTYSCRKT
ncbi:MAG: hypothetical protein ACK4TA_05760 [Saprospiraceae bacterium]